MPNCNILLVAGLATTYLALTVSGKDLLKQYFEVECDDQDNAYKCFAQANGDYDKQEYCFDFYNCTVVDPWAQKVLQETSKPKLNQYFELDCDDYDNALKCFQQANGDYDKQEYCFDFYNCTVADPWALSVKSTPAPVLAEPSSKHLLKQYFEVECDD